MSDLLVAGGEFRLFVLVGVEPTFAEVWARVRGIPRSRFVEIRDVCSVPRLRMVDGAGVAVASWAPDLNGDPDDTREPGRTFGRLYAQGARDVSPRWWPGDE